MAIRTARLELVPATLALVGAALDDAGELGRLLAARVPASWPPEYLDQAALDFTRARLEAVPAELGWWLYFVVLRDKDPARCARTFERERRGRLKLPRVIVGPCAPRVTPSSISASSAKSSRRAPGLPCWRERSCPICPSSCCGHASACAVARRKTSGARSTPKGPG